MPHFEAKLERNTDETYGSSGHSEYEIYQTNCICLDCTVGSI